MRGVGFHQRFTCAIRRPRPANVDHEIFDLVLEPTKFTWATDPKSGARTKKAARGSKWKARYTDPSGRDRRRTFERKIDAEKFLERIGTEMQTSEWIDPETTKSRFDDWVEIWLKTTVKLAPSTRRGYEKMLRLYLRPKFDGRKINSIEWLEVELFAASLLEKELSAKTVREPSPCFRSS